MEVTHERLQWRDVKSVTENRTVTDTDQPTGWQRVTGSEERSAA
jgi:hypothetical protein